MVEVKVLALIVDRAPFGVTEVDASSSLRDDLGYDGIGLIELSMEIEDDFGIVVSDEVMHSWETVGDVLGTVRRLGVGV